MKFFKVIIYVTISGLCSTSMAETLTPEQVLQKVIDHYPSINIAAIEIERARQSIKVANSQLGWQLDAQAGIERGVSLFGTASDSLSLGAGVSRMLDSGSSIAFDGAVRREDSETVFSPTFPNPATTSNIGLSYRQPLAKNTAHSSFQASRISAKLDLETSMAETDEMYDQLALKVIDLYFSAAVLLAKTNNIDQSIKRAKRLQSYINNKTSLGVSEQKDILQVNAQLDSLIAEKRNLEISWMQQMVALNRLMERPWNSAISTTYKITSLNKDAESLFAQAKKYSPKIKLINSRLALADSAIQTRRDERENSMDLVWFAGAQSQKGDTSLGSSSESELTGGLRLEYKQSIDKSGVDAQLYQAQLERSTVLQDRKLLLENLHYDLSSLLAEIEANRLALNAYEKSHRSEKIKIDEAMKRYRSGRIDTDVLITFEDQLTQAKFSLELQRISLMQRQYKLQIMLGELWQKIKKPVIHDFMTDSPAGVDVR
ncbi:MAG: TolC family protein [Gammaproteobacteria bacterium]